MKPNTNTILRLQILEGSDVSYYNRSILKVAAWSSFVHISWLVVLIGVPIVFFADGLTLFEKSLFWLGLLCFFWLVYLAMNVLFHRLCLRNENNRVSYISKSDKERGKAVGIYLEGW